MTPQTLIVSDNSPLNLLIRVGQARVLPAMFTKVIIPPQVATEMNHPKAPDPVRAFIASPPPWLAVQRPSLLLSFPELDPGEVAAISLAVELKAVLMVDEQDGRRAAVAQGLQIIGAIGVLERAAKVGLIPDLAAVYAHVRSLRFHVSDEILADSLERVKK
ncbi:MAG: DUF3368 domain-containing protein [Planctomycetota bacterium]